MRRAMRVVDPGCRDVGGLGHGVRPTEDTSAGRISDESRRTEDHVHLSLRGKGADGAVLDRELCVSLPNAIENDLFELVLLGVRRMITKQPIAFSDGRALH